MVVTGAMAVAVSAVIEDAAEAAGSSHNGRSCGAIGDAGTFSFFSNKVITTGEGGMVVFRDADAAERRRAGAI